MKPARPVTKCDWMLGRDPLLIRRSARWPGLPMTVPPTARSRGFGAITHCGSAIGPAMRLQGPRLIRRGRRVPCIMGGICHIMPFYSMPTAWPNPGAHDIMTCPHCLGIDRRSLLGLLGLGIASVLAGCDIKPDRAATAANHVHPSPQSTTTAPPPPPSPSTAAPTAIPPPARGPSQVISQGQPAAVAARQVAITIDDGYCAECAKAYAALAQATGIHITFNPNGCYGYIWTPLAKTLKPLIESGQVQIGNHTFNHRWLTDLADTQITAQLEQNEEWIEQTYGITARPWWRPPYGAHDERTDELAASIGYTNVLMWNGSYGDSTLLRPRVLLNLAREYLHPGVVMLGHANHPTVTRLFPQIAEIIASRGLHPVTLDEMFGTSRSTGRSA
jgi:peptidoglycan/xylan/chitin deacetylase (PgdA/CDA1 family)